MSWVVNNNELTNTDFISLGEYPLTNPYPYPFWEIKNNSITTEFIENNLFPEYPLTSPYPYPFWEIKESKITTEFIENNSFPEYPLTSPYPYPFWEIKNNSITTEFVENTPIEIMGTFYNNINLHTIIIPQTVKYIGEHCFYQTNLKNVKIADDCIYKDNSFPDDCDISYYE